MKLQLGQTVRRTSMWNDVVIRELQSQQEINNYYAMQKEGFALEVLIDTTWLPVPRLMTIHRAPPEICEACSA